MRNREMAIAVKVGLLDSTGAVVLTLWFRVLGGQCKGDRG